MKSLLKQPQVARILRRNYRVLHVERAKQGELPKLSMHIHTFPTLYILDSHREVIKCPHQRTAEHSESDENALQAGHPC